MNGDLLQEIVYLENEIENEEKKIQNAAAKDDFDAVSKSTTIIHSDLKYLSIIVNGAPLDPKECRMVMDFIRVHYENLARIPIHA